jgi:dCMP deaminase
VLCRLFHCGSAEPTDSRNERGLRRSGPSVGRPQDGRWFTSHDMPHDAPMDERPCHDPYFMNIAFAVRERANCKGQRVGAVLVQENRIISTGYNGTAEKMQNCEDGGCYRCANRKLFKSGTGYDLCVCVHAEQNALLSAGRFGASTNGSILYTTTRPCFGCTKELLQAKVQAVYYHHEWRHPDDQLWHEYERLSARIPAGLNRVDAEDARAAWALGRLPGDVPDTGHTTPGDEGNGRVPASRKRRT